MVLSRHACTTHTRTAHTNTVSVSQGNHDRDTRRHGYGALPITPCDFSSQLCPLFLHHRYSLISIGLSSVPRLQPTASSFGQLARRDTIWKICTPDPQDAPGPPFSTGVSVLRAHSRLVTRMYSSYSSALHRLLIGPPNRLSYCPFYLGYLPAWTGISAPSFCLCSGSPSGLTTIAGRMV